MFSFLSTYLAQNPKSLGGELKGIGPLGLEGKNPWDIFTFFPRIISTIIGVLTAAAILWFILQFILGTYKWISSGGDSKAVESARSQIIQAVTGFILVLLALVLLSVLGGIFGLDLLDLQGILHKLDPKGVQNTPSGIPPGIDCSTSPVC